MSKERLEQIAKELILYLDEAVGNTEEMKTILRYGIEMTDEEITELTKELCDCYIR